MLVKVIKENKNKVRKWNLNLEELKHTMPEYNWDKSYINSIEDVFKPYKHWMLNLKNHIKNDSLELKLIEDDNIDFEGVFICGNNPHHDIELLTDMKVVKNKDGLSNEYYGVCDNATQAIKYYKKLLNEGLLNCNKNYLITLSIVYKEMQPKYNGWRWSKHGEYIGVQNPLTEYIYDEPNIDLVYSFSILEIEH